MPKLVLNIHDKIYIRANYLKGSSRKLARCLGYDRGVVARYKKKAKLLVPKELGLQFRRQTQTGKTIFTWQMDKTLRENYLQIPEKPLAVQLGISSTCLRNRMKQLGLVVPKKLIEERKNKGRFTKGQVSHNKGRKMEEYMTKAQIKKLKSTQFKKGNKPHNTLKGAGHIRIRRDNKTGIDYQYIKISDGDWQLLSRVTWEKENGPIPENHVIIFKDGNSLNCKIDNLECISMRENACRNTQAFHNLPQPLKKAIKLKNKLKKALK